MRARSLVRSFLSTLVLAAAITTAPQAAAAEDGPNYHWTDDIQSQILAGRPGPVLHRAGGSWFNAPDIPQASRDAQARGVSLFGPGTPLFVGPSTLCTLGAVGYDNQGRKLGITAGHCGAVGDLVASADSWQIGATALVAHVNRELDYAVILFGPDAEITRSYNGITVNALGGVAQNQQTLCKQGVASGWTCGVSWENTGANNISQVCAMQGDSGAPMLIGDRFVGIVSGGALPFAEWSCQSPLQGPVHSPTRSTNADAIFADLNAMGSIGAGFHLP